MLSHHEDRELKAIEQWFEEFDPALTRMLREHDMPRRSRRRLAGRVAIDVLGVALFLFGAVLAFPLAVVLGVLLIMVGAALHVAAAARRRQPPPH